MITSRITLPSGTVVELFASDETLFNKIALNEDFRKLAKKYMEQEQKSRDQAKKQAKKRAKKAAKQARRKARGN